MWHPICDVVELERKNRMTIEKAIKVLTEEYEKAAEQEWVRDPVAYALYQTWKKSEEKQNESSISN